MFNIRIYQNMPCLISENDWHWRKGGVGDSYEQDQVRFCSTMLSRQFFLVNFICKNQSVSWAKILFNDSVEMRKSNFVFICCGTREVEGSKFESWKSIFYSKLERKKQTLGLRHLDMGLKNVFRKYFLRCILEHFLGSRHLDMGLKNAFRKYFLRCILKHTLG